MPWPSAFAFILSATALTGATQQAPPSPPSTQPTSEIVITGRARDALRNFVQSLSQVGPTGQIARWDGYLCPTVIGIDPVQARFVEDRIVTVGRALHLRPGRANCLTSLIVVVTPNPGAFAADLVRQYPVTLGADGVSRLKGFVGTQRAVRWISVTDECGGGCELPNSRLLKSTKPTLSAMVVVVDAAKISGYSLGELSDYVALVGLSNPPLDRNPPSQSILAMFELPRGPGSSYELTAYDRSFLSGLYETTLDDGALGQRSTIVTHMKKDQGSQK